jgi:hypothetical protein
MTREAFQAVAMTTTLHLVRGLLMDEEGWRYCPLGCYQKYVSEGDEREARLHLWHPDLVAENIEENGGMHDHRFSFRSTVLFGALTDSVMSPVGFGVATGVAGETDYHSWEVKNYRTEEEEVKPFGKLRVANRKKSIRTYEDGQSYTLGAGIFHTSKPEKLTLTFVEKYPAPLPEFARILTSKYLKPRHFRTFPVPSENTKGHFLEMGVGRLGKLIRSATAPYFETP